jgi:hypothetical protein
MKSNDTPAQESAARLDESHYTYHTEPARVGGARYARCIHCGRESIHGKREVLHTEDCQLRRDA